MRIVISLLFALALLGSVSIANAQMMGGDYGQPYGMIGDTADIAAQSQVAPSTDETQGAAIWNALSSGQTSCAALTDNDFDLLGDYFMGQMMGSYHEQMDTYMAQRLGEQGDTQMHIAMGKRFSGCNTTVAYPSGFSGYAPMMMGMMGGYGMPMGYGMMYGYGRWPYSFFDIALYAFAIIGLISTIRWALDKRRGTYMQ